MQHTGQRQFSGVTFRIAREVGTPYAIAGGALTLGYRLIFDFLRGHHGNNERPMFIDHTIALTAVTVSVGFIYGGLP